MPVTVHLGRADHEVDVDLALVRRARGRSRRSGTGSPGRARCGWPRSRRAACRRRRCRARRCGPRASTSATSPSRAAPLVVLDDRAHRRPARCRRRSAPRGRPRSARAGRARRSRRSARAASSTVTCPSARSGSGVVKTSSVGRFGMCSMPPTVSKRAACQRGAGQQPDRQVGAGTLVVQRVEARARSAAAAAPTSVSARSRHAAIGSASSSRSTCTQLALEPLSASAADRGPGRRASAQAGVGHGHDRPVGRPLVDDLARLLARPAAGPGRRARDRGRRAGPGADGPDSAIRAARCSPSASTRSPYQRRHEVERLVARVLDAGALDPGVEPLRRRRTSRRGGRRSPRSRARAAPCRART